MNFIESSKEAARGGFSNIKTVRGDVIDMGVVDPPETWTSRDKVFKVSLKNAVILERFDPDDDFELKNGEFSFTYTYAVEGKRPTHVGPYMRCLVMPLEKIGKKPSQLIGAGPVTFSKIPTEAGFSAVDRNSNSKEKKPVIYTNYFVPVEPDGADNADTLVYIRSGVAGKNLKQALRWLIMDERAKNLPEFKDALNAGVLAEKLGLSLVNDVFEEPTELTDETSIKEASREPAGVS